MLLGLLLATGIMAQAAPSPIAGPTQTSCLPMDSKVTLYLNKLDETQEYTLVSETFASQVKWRFETSGNKKELAEFMKTQSSRLFWDLKPATGKKDETYFSQPLRNNPYAVYVKDEQGAIISQATFCREYWAPQKSERVMIDEDDMQAVFYRPKFQDNSPVVIRFGGSEGGINSQDGGLLANYGIASLTVGYHRGTFNNPRLPENLTEIPVEIVGRAIAWVKQQESIDPDKIYLYGVSRGSELALLGAALYPEIKGVVAVVPSSVSWDGYFSDYNKYKELPSWTWQGKPLAFVKPVWADEFSKPKPWTFADGFLRGLAPVPADSPTRLPVELIQGKILLISGTDDKMWPSSMMAEQLTERAKKANADKDIVHLKYEGAGHLIGIPYAPTMIQDRIITYGGNAEANAKASEDSWPKIIKFFRGK